MNKVRFHNKMIVAGLAITVGIVPMAMAQDRIVAAETNMITLCGPLFAIDSNAAKLTAAERAKIVQKNLDNALIAAKNRTPSAVQVEISNRHPIVTLDGYHVVTADENSAQRNRLTRMELAEKWADSIRMCLANAAEVNKYLSMLTGKFPTVKKAAFTIQEKVAIAPSGMYFPVQLATPLSTELSREGDPIELVLSTDVPLQTDPLKCEMAAYLPKGTVVRGTLTDASQHTPNDFAGKDALVPHFMTMVTPDGKHIPIDGHIMGAVNAWKFTEVKPERAESCDSLSMIKEHAMTHVLPGKGEIVGGWRGERVDALTLSPYQRFVLSKTYRRIGEGNDRLLVVPAGAPMFLQLSATTTIAIATPIQINEPQIAVTEVHPM